MSKITESREIQTLVANYGFEIPVMEFHIQSNPCGNLGCEPDSQWAIVDPMDAEAEAEAKAKDAKAEAEAKAKAYAIAIERIQSNPDYIHGQNTGWQNERTND